MVNDELKPNTSTMNTVTIKMYSYISIPALLPPISSLKEFYPENPATTERSELDASIEKT